jgi:hypothetical protein
LYKTEDTATNVTALADLRETLDTTNSESLMQEMGARMEAMYSTAVANGISEGILSEYSNIITIFDALEPGTDAFATMAAYAEDLESGMLAVLDA